MNTTTTRRTITAVPCGHDRHGSPIKRREYEVTREPEPFNPDPEDVNYATWDGRDRSRLWGKAPATVTSRRAGLDREAPLVVVFTDSIEPVRR